MADQETATWPEPNRRRWELIAKKVREGLTETEQKELALLQQPADEELARVGQRAGEELERLAAELNPEG